MILHRRICTSRPSMRQYRLSDLCHSVRFQGVEPRGWSMKLNPVWVRLPMPYWNTFLDSCWDSSGSLATRPNALTDSLSHLYTVAKSSPVTILEIDKGEFEQPYSPRYSFSGCQEKSECVHQVSVQNESLCVTSKAGEYDC